MVRPSRWLTLLAALTLITAAGCNGADDEGNDTSGSETAGSTSGTDTGSGETAGSTETGADTGTDTGDTSDTGDTGAEKPTFSFGEIVGHTHVEYAEDLVVVGDHAYVTSKQDGLRVFDVSDPRVPKARGAIDTLDQAWDVAADDGLLFLADYAGGLRIFDITTDPANPAEVGSWDDGWTVISVAFDPAAPRVFVGGGDGQNGAFAVIDITDPSAPTVAGTWLESTGADSAASSLAYGAGYAYYGRAEGTVYALDVSDPTAITQAGQYYNAGTVGHSPWALGLFVDGDRMYLSDWGAGVIVLDISDPGFPTELGVFDEGGYAFYDTWAEGDRAYIALDGGLGVLDVSDPTTPTLVGGSYISTKLTLDDGLHGVWVEGDFAYVSDNKEKELTVVYVGP